jgi:hypothetical protein
MSYSNQLDHSFLNRNLVIPTLISQTNCSIEELENDVTNRLESLLSKCESELEKETLRAIAGKNIPLSTEAQKTIYEGDEPVTRVDFYY